MDHPVKRLLRQAYFSKRFNKIAVKLYSRLYPPPYQRPNMEFDTDVWNGICTFHAHDGRQIGENNTNPEIYRETIETEHKICKFEGQRNGLPINVTALRQVMAVWNDGLQFTTLLRNDYLRRRGLPGPRMNLLQGYVFSKLGAGYASFMARRADQPITALPPLETAFFTLGVGPFMVVRTFMEKGDLAVLTPEPLSADTLYEMADSSRTLISSYSGKGCAGSKKLILEFLDVTMNGTYQRELTSPEARRAIDAVGDWDRLYRYVYASSRLELLVKLAQSLCAQALHALHQHPEVLAPSERAAVEAALARSHHRPDGADVPDDRTLMSNFQRVVLALIDEFDAPAIRRELVAARLAAADGSATPVLDAPGGDLRQAAARRIRQACALLHPPCREELASLHRELRRFEDASISLDDLYRRCAGPGLIGLVRQLEASPAPVAAAAVPA